ncbi:hypothetical protein COV82_00825 [Candidatus Peregrinibacteria bacterium CG11_big_fil_rev_8_21_14_0_20_46_8]|nr:MAG: hypothetical protein COV82_00825 [Candidatus Peregrinibacteria bacterium CG11_big_fil_rev_8_21_14_0_20_46_8]
MIFSFDAIILYLKIVTIFIGFMSFYGIFFQTFDPTGWMENQMSRAMFGKDKLTDEQARAFRFPMMLFCLASLCLAIFMYAFIHYVLAEQVLWAWYIFMAPLVLWFVFAGWYTLRNGLRFYFLYSVIPFELLYVPALLLLKPYLV